MGCEIPEIIKLEDYKNFEEYENNVYNLFLETIQNKDLFFKGQKIEHKKHPLKNGKSGTYYHITTSGQKEDNRSPDLKRYERILWPSYILNYCVDNCKNILVWENKRGNKNRILIWCKYVNYLIVLEKRNDYILFWTSYPITYNHYKKKLQKEYNNYKDKAKKQKSLS